jgi:hypothetical protein
MQRTGWATALTLILGLAACSPDADAPEWSVVQAERPLIDGAKVSETVWSTPRSPRGQFDTIRVHRYRASTKPIASLLYLPGTNMNASAALTDERHNLWLYLAARGIDVFALDYRTNAVPPASDIERLGEMKGWTSTLFMSDVRAARDLMLRETRDVPVFVSGFSRGVVFAYMLAGEDPSLAGIIALDGSFKAAAHQDYDAAAELAALEAKGIWASDVGGGRGWDARQALMDAAAENPASPALEPGYADIGSQLAHVLQTAWGPGGLANPEGGVSHPQILAILMRGYDRYYPAIQDIEMKRMVSLADDPASALDDGWGRMAMPVLAFASTGMGAEWQANVRYSAEASGSRDVTVSVLDTYGHLDVLVAEAAPELVFQPMRDWIAARTGQ